MTARELLRRDVLPTATFVALLVLSATVCHGQASIEPSAIANGKTVKLPGLLINLEHGCVDLEAEICLNEGVLELVACTKGTKEHESIVAIAARPMHVHTALLLLEANNGHPAMQQPTNEEKTRWVNLPPQGDAIDVSLAFENANGTAADRPIGDFIARSEDWREKRNPNENDEAANNERLSHTFLFAGSQLRDGGKGPLQYLADESGNVISIVTFGDELLCLPGIQSHENGALLWQVDATHLPKVGTKVTLRLRPQKPTTEANKP